MKFSSALKFNAAPEWWDEYIAYDILKKFIYQLEKQQQGLEVETPYRDLEAGVETALLDIDCRDPSSRDAAFIPLLDSELRKITQFYELQSKELFNELAILEELITQHEEAGVGAGDNYLEDDTVGVDGDDDDDDDDEEEHGDPGHASSSGRFRHRRRRSSSARQPRFPESIPEEASYRDSISSSEGGYPTEMEASLATLNLQPPILMSLSPAARRAENPSRSLSPTARRATRSTSPTARRTGAGAQSRSPADSRPGGLTGRLRHMKDSFTTVASSERADDNVWTAKSSYAWDIRLLYKRKITNLYVSMSSLRSYVEVNYSGFRKILKKYDKVTYSELKDQYMRNSVEQSLPFTHEAKEALDAVLDTLVSLYARCVTRGDKSLASQQLKLHQREHVAWERNTVWRQMIAQERRGVSETADVGLAGATLVHEEEKGLASMPTPFGKLKITKKLIFLLLSIVVFVMLLNVQTVVGLEANRCFAILVFSTILWATEAIPLFVTSMMVPLLLVVFRVIRDEGEEQESAQDATKFIFSVMFSSTIMLLIGGFTISSALSKTNIDRVLITRVLSFAGTNPHRVLLAFMGVSCFASMWISNVASPTLCFALIRPILRTLPPRSSFAPALILGIALAANIGGQSSPISSPQNLIALDHMDSPISWGSWFAVAIPVSIISVVLIWLLLLVSYRPACSPDGEGEIEIRGIRPSREPFTPKQWWVSFVCVGTIVLWCVAHEIDDYMGDMGVIAIIPIIAFFGSGVLKRDDFEQFAWTIVFLAMGGVALGKGVTASGLLETFDHGIQDMLEGLQLYTVVLVLSPVVLIISTFISHTIASVLLVPIVKEVGKNLPEDHERLLIFITALICSTGMGMPVSGFPNQTAANQADDLGQLYLTNVDFLKNGIPASIIATIVVATVGYLLMRAIGL